jgi:hypothetical protein
MREAFSERTHDVPKLIDGTTYLFKRYDVPSDQDGDLERRLGQSGHHKD